MIAQKRISFAALLPTGAVVRRTIDGRTAKHKGSYFDEQSGNLHVLIMINGKRKYLGRQPPTEKRPCGA